MGVQACRLPGLKPLKPLQRLKIFLARPTPQATGTPGQINGFSWAFKLAVSQPFNIKTLKNLFGTPNSAGNRLPKARSMASYGRSSLPFASLLTLKTLQTLKHPLGMPTSQAKGTPRPHQWLLQRDQDVHGQGGPQKTAAGNMHMLPTPPLTRGRRHQGASPFYICIWMYVYIYIHNGLKW